MSQPNVVIFFTDQQRHDSTGMHGNPLDLTPNFDRMAQRGTHLHHSFTSQPVCGPARACLQTGTHQTTNGCHTNGYPMPDGLDGIGHRFSHAGYRTGYIGKWHLAGSDNPRGPVPPERRGGYQYWLAADALEHTSSAYHTAVYDNDGNERHLPGYRVDGLTDAGIRFIDEHGRDQPGQPFFLMMSFLEPHHQNHLDDYSPPDGYRERYTGRWTPPDLAALPGYRFDDPHDPNRHRIGGSAQQHLGGYWGMVKRLDEALGRLFDALKSLGICDNTIVLFTSDHACHFKTRNSEYKRSCHESSIRVPTAICGPGFNGGGRVNEMFSLVDLAPTLLDAAGIPIPDSMEGHALGRLLRRELQVDQYGLGEEDDGVGSGGGVVGDDSESERWPDDMFVQISEDGVGRAIRTHRWKYAVSAPQDVAWNGGSDQYAETHLYDLETDPYELTNLIHSRAHAEVREVMRGRLLARMKKIGEPEPKIVRGKQDDSGQRSVTQAESRL